MAPALVERDSTVRQDQALHRFAAHHLPAVERALARALDGLLLATPDVARAAVAAVDPGGRDAHRWRPLVVLAAAEACGAPARSALPVGVAVELTHTASLILDDLPCMDDAATRRGQPSTHARIGSAGAILVAVGLLGRAAELVGGVPACGGTLAREWGAAVGLEGMAGGQVVDLQGARRDRTAGSSRRLHRRKTTALAAFSARAGGLIAGATGPILRALGSFGDHLGWAYQLRDDDADNLEDGPGSRIAGAEQLVARRRRHVRRATLALASVGWSRPETADTLVAAARMIAGVADGVA